MKRSKLLTAVGSLAMLGGLLVTTEAATAAGDCPDGWDCTRPLSMQDPEYKRGQNDVGPYADNDGNGAPLNSVQAGLTTSLALHEVAVTEYDVDPDGSGKVAKTCYEDSNADNTDDMVPDKVIMQPVWTIWRHVKVHVELIFRWCMRQVDSANWHYWYTPKTLFARFSMDSEDIGGNVPRFWCQTFHGIELDGQVVDGSGKSQSFQTFQVPCVTGWYSNSGWVDISRIWWKKFHYQTEFGYPKWTASVKSLNNPPGILDFPDLHFPHTPVGRLNPN